MSNFPRCVILFQSTSHAVRAEKILNSLGITSKLIPVPRELSSECGVCLMVACEDTDRAVAALKSAAVRLSGIHVVSRL